MNRREFLFAAGGGCGVMLLAAGAARAVPCAPTAPNPAGPFYVPNSPFGEVIAHPEESGRRLTISGRVLAVTSEGCVPLADAEVDVWHASDQGVYYGLEGGNAREPHLLRGRVRTDVEGRYSFRTILPGHYPLSRTRYRPRHIHVMVRAAQHRTLITQLYFRGDPWLQGDPLARPSLVIDLKENEGALAGFFELALLPER